MENGTPDQNGPFGANFSAGHEKNVSNQMEDHFAPLSPCDSILKDTERHSVNCERPPASYNESSVSTSQSSLLLRRTRGELNAGPKWTISYEFFTIKKSLDFNGG